MTSLNQGGIQRWILQVLEIIPRANFTMDVLCQGFQLGEWAIRARNMGAKVMLNTLTPDHLVFGIRLARILRNYDILHIHVGVYSGFPTWVAHKMNLKVITTFHNVQFPAQRWFLKIPVIESLRKLYARASIKYAVENSNYLVGVSQAALDAFVPDRKHLRAKSYIIPHGVAILQNKSAHSKRLFRSNLGWPDKSKLIINVGRFHPQKNHLGVLKVFKKICENSSDARLVLVGAGPLLSEIKKEVRESSLDHSVAFLGFRDDAAEIMGCCDLMLMPSLYEGFGIAAIEASAAGLPVVGSRVPGLVEAVEEGRTGLLFEPHDVSGMADAIVRLLSDSDFAEKMGSVGRERVREDFSVQAMANNYMKLYRRCLSEAIPIEGFGASG